MILVIYVWISVWITIQATEKYSAAMYYIMSRRLATKAGQLQDIFMRDPYKQTKLMKLLLKLIVVDQEVNIRLLHF